MVEFSRFVFMPIKRGKFDVDEELRAQDAAARGAQRNLLIAIAVIGGLGVLALVRDLPGLTMLLGVTLLVLVVSLAIVTLSRRSMRRAIGDS